MQGKYPTKADLSRWGASARVAVDKDYSHVLTAEKRHMFCALIQQGLPIRTSAQLCEMSHFTIQNYLLQGRRDIDLHMSEGVPLSNAAQFAMKVDKARAWFQKATIDKFSKAMDEDPRAGSAYLELLGRLHPDEMGRRQVVRVEQDKVLKVVFVEKDGSEWQAGHRAIAVPQAAPMSHQIEAAPLPPPEGNEIIDSELRDSKADDDNVF